LWISQLGLGLLFLVAGGVRVAAGERVTGRVGWLADVPARVRRLLGVAEVACAVCLLSPALMRSDLAPLSALMLGVAMCGALVLHLRREDAARALASTVLFGVCMFVAVGCFFLMPLF
jgi:hypothetical protein